MQWLVESQVRRMGEVGWEEVCRIVVRASRGRVFMEGLRRST